MWHASPRQFRLHLTRRATRQRAQLLSPRSSAQPAHLQIKSGEGLGKTGLVLAGSGLVAYAAVTVYKEFFYTARVIGAEGRLYCGAWVGKEGYHVGPHRWRECIENECTCNGYCGPEDGCQCSECYIASFAQYALQKQVASIDASASAAQSASDSGALVGHTGHSAAESRGVTEGHNAPAARANTGIEAPCGKQRPRTNSVDSNLFQFDLVPKAVTQRNFSNDSSFARVTKDRSVIIVGEPEHPTLLLGNRAVPGSGRSYWEIEVVSRQSKDDWDAVGIALADINPCKLLGYDKMGWCISGNGISSCLRAQGRTIRSRGYPVLAEGESFGLDVDLDNGTLSIWKEGEIVGTPIKNLEGKELYPAVCIYGTGTVLRVTPAKPPQLKEE